MIKKGQIKPTVYQPPGFSGESTYMGLESVPRAMKDLAARKVWGKAVILVSGDKQGGKARL